MSRANEPVHPGMVTTGITLREHFAAMAMQGLMAQAKVESIDLIPDMLAVVAEVAVRQADALITELAKEKT
jgi:hypothetical protein